MIVTMIRQISGTRDGVDWPAPGESIDVPDDEAAGLIDNGLAKVSDEAPAGEAPAGEAPAGEAPAGEAPAGRKGARQATAEPA